MAPPPTAIGTTMATATSEPMSSITAEVMTRVATTEFCRPSLRSETIVSETAVAVMASAHIRDTSVSSQIASATA